MSRGDASPGDIAARRDRLAAAEQRLVSLEGRYDVLTSRFKFDEAARLRPLIDAARSECETLAAGLPAAAEPAPAPYAVAARRPLRRR